MEEVDAVSDVAPDFLYLRIAVHVAELPQAETVVVLRGGFRETVHEDVGRLGMESLWVDTKGLRYEQSQT